jgi:hypothetical protein
MRKSRFLLGVLLSNQTPLVGDKFKSSAGPLPSSMPLPFSQTEQRADLQPQHTAEATAGLKVRAPLDLPGPRSPLPRFTPPHSPFLPTARVPEAQEARHPP